MIYQEESIQKLWPELMPLLQQHFEEISANQDIPLNPDIDRYNHMDELGMIRVYTAREDDGTLVGYGAFFVHSNMHYVDSFQAVQDVLFLRKDKRLGMTGVKLIKYAEKMLRAEKVQIVYHHVKTAHNFGPILKRLGYNHIENIHSKRLDK